MTEREYATSRHHQYRRGRPALSEASATSRARARLHRIPSIPFLLGSTLLVLTLHSKPLSASPVVRTLHSLTNGSTTNNPLTQHADSSFDELSTLGQFSVESLSDSKSRLPAPAIWQRIRMHLFPYSVGSNPSSRFLTRFGMIPTLDDVIDPPVITVPMIAVPPRDHIVGSTKGMPYRVRIIHMHRRRRRQAGFIGGHQRLPKSYPEWISKSITTRMSQGLIYTVDLHGGIVGVGEYFSEIEIGGKSIRVQIDTGSSTLAVPMRGCVSCIKKPNRYAVEESDKAAVVSCDSEQCAADRCSTNCPVCSQRGACCSKERPAECGFSLRYADGSAASGSVVRDEMRWGSLKSTVTFGGILHNSPNFERPEVDGILGMAYKNLACNPSCFDPPFDSFVAAGLVKDVFSICVTPTGGKLMLGGYDSSVSQSEVSYVPLSHPGAERYYRVALNGKFGIGDEEVALPDFRSAIVDTGTTLIVTSTRTFAAIKEEMERRFCTASGLCGQGSWFQSGMCVNLSDEDLALMPPLTFTVGDGLKLKLRAEDYMLSYQRGRRQYRCVGIMGMDGLGGMVVLGNTLMQRYVTIYDRRNGRIGFAEAAPRCGD